MSTRRIGLPRPSGRRDASRIESPAIALAPNDFARTRFWRGTLAHETTHWTAHESRLARDFGTTRFGAEGYAIEELVAELGAAFLCADLDLTLEPREDHAANIATGWTFSPQITTRSSLRRVTRSAQRTSSTACSRPPPAKVHDRYIRGVNASARTERNGLGGANLGSSTHRDCSGVTW